MSKKRRFRSGDLELWERVRSSVKPMDATSRIRSDKIEAEASDGDAKSLSIAPKIGTPVPRPKIEEKIQLYFKTQLPTSHLKGLNRSTQRGVRKGQIEPSASVDLHGLRVEAARDRLFHFLMQSSKSGHKVVLVITGKGGYRRMSEHGVEVSGVIRRALPEWMHEKDFARLVSHYTPSHIKHGGDGAWYVFLRNPNKKRF